MAVLQISHGMVEYINRYDEFAAFLAKQGYAVVGNDHLGHGKSVQDDSWLGYFAEKEGNIQSGCYYDAVNRRACFGHG